MIVYQKVIEKIGGSFLDHLLAFSFSTVLTDVVTQKCLSGDFLFPLGYNQIYGQILSTPTTATTATATTTELPLLLPHQYLRQRNLLLTAILPLIHIEISFRIIAITFS